MLKCNCGSIIPKSLCEKTENGKCICPVCKSIETDVPIKVSLRKDGEDIEIPVPVVEQNGNPVPPTAESLINSIDNGIRSAFGDAITVCPECGKAICICSLKGIFKSLKL